MRAFVLLIAGVFALWFGIFLLIQFGVADTAALVYVTVIGFMLIAAALYALRSSNRLLFGLIEVVFGAVILVVAANSYYAASGSPSTTCSEAVRTRCFSSLTCAGNCVQSKGSRAFSALRTERQIGFWKSFRRLDVS
jgi:membrane-bound ClpP family serine protease